MGPHAGCPHPRRRDLRRPPRRAARPRARPPPARRPRRRLATGTLQGEPGHRAAPTGESYFLQRVEYDRHLTGHIALGPFVVDDGGLTRSSGALPPPDPPASILALGPDLDPTVVAEAWSRVPRLAPGRIEEIAAHVSTVLEVMLFSGHKALVTSQMHLASVQESYRELCEKNESLAEAYERLKELDRLKSNFLATVSHELRTPLTSIMGYGEMLAEGVAGALNDEQREFVETIRGKSEQLLGLIMSLLDLSKLESGTMPVRVGRLSLASVIAEAVSTIRPTALKKGVALEADVPADLPPVLGDADRLRQVFINLTDNAVKFTPPNGYVRLVARLTTTRTAGEPGLVLVAPLRPVVEIRVEDTGIGIAEEERERVFDPFYQIDQSSTREYGGAGLGLAIVKRLVEAHQGTIHVEENSPSGAVFVVTLPAGRTSVLPPARQTTPPAPPACLPSSAANPAPSSRAERVRYRPRKDRSMRWDGKVAIVTGASSGIGEAVARAIVAGGGKVALVARSRGNLDALVRALGEDRAASFPLDFGDRAGIAALPSQVVARFGRLDVVVNNAGVNHRGAVAERSAAELAAIMDVNLVAPILLTRAALPHLGPGAAIVNVASLAGKVPVPHEATYSATKAGLRAFSRALAVELSDRDVHVAVVCPGPVDTGFFGDLATVPDLVFSQPMSTAEEVAAAVLQAVEARVPEIDVPALSGKLATLGYLSPGFFRRAVPLFERVGARNKRRFHERKRAGRWSALSGGLGVSPIVDQGCPIRPRRPPPRRASAPPGPRSPARRRWPRGRRSSRGGGRGRAGRGRPACVAARGRAPVRGAPGRRG